MFALTWGDLYVLDLETAAILDVYDHHGGILDITVDETGDQLMLIHSWCKDDLPWNHHHEIDALALADFETSASSPLPVSAR